MTSIRIPIDHESPVAPDRQAGSPRDGSASKWSSVRHAVKVASIAKDKDKVSKVDTLPISSTGTSASAAFARSLVLFTGFLFRRPSKLFRPSRVDTWAGLRQLAISSDQSLSPTFIRSLLRQRTGMIAMALAILPPLLVNTSMGFILFTSHSLFSLGLARLDFFQRPKHEDDQQIARYRPAHGSLPFGFHEHTSDVNEEGEEAINLDTLLRGPTIIPNHPTLLSAIAGAGAGLLQGLAFTPVENVVRFLQQYTTSLTAMAAQFLHLPIKVHQIPKGFDPAQPATPVQAIRNLFASGTWRKSATWWNGWRWAVTRDALSYSCFFAAFDVTRRVGLRVKALFGGNIESDWNNILVLDFGEGGAADKCNDEDDHKVPTIARVAQATTIVTGGVIASILAEMAGRPFRACQRIIYLNDLASKQAVARLRQGTQPILVGGPAEPVNPILRTFREKGLRPFLQPDKPPPSSTKPIDGAIQRQGAMKRMMKRVGWRMAAVGPWGFGFLVWAWVGGEV
ncbi:hypothetical protein IAU60_000284 [Kwoniella sp. DSM 27419]